MVRLRTAQGVFRLGAGYSGELDAMLLFKGPLALRAHAQAGWRPGNWRVDAAAGPAVLVGPLTLGLAATDPHCRGAGLGPGSGCRGPGSALVSCSALTGKKGLGPCRGLPGATVLDHVLRFDGRCAEDVFKINHLRAMQFSPSSSFCFTVDSTFFFATSSSASLPLRRLP